MFWAAFLKSFVWATMNIETIGINDSTIYLGDLLKRSPGQYLACNDSK